MTDPPETRGPGRDDPLERLRQFERERGLEESADEPEATEPAEQDEDAKQPP